METLSEWFNKEVLRWRTGAATAWSLILTVQFGFFFMILATFSFLDPYVTIFSCVMRIVTAEFWILMAMLAFSVVIHIQLNAAHFRVTCDIPRTRWQLLWSYIRPRRMLFILGHMLACSLAAVCATKLVGVHYGDLYYPCPQLETLNCLNETHLFIVVIGCIYGMMSSIKFFTSGSFVLRFPAVSQRKLFEVNDRLGVMLMMSAKCSFRYLKYYCVVYYLGMGLLVRAFLARSLHLDINSEVASLSTLRGLIDPSLLFYTWFILAFIDFIFSLPHLLFTVYYTEPFTFPIETAVEWLNGKCLHHAIACDHHPLIQHLGCLDLARLAKFSPSRRRLLFSLTCLGGQPTNWINVRTACIVQLNNFIDSLLSYGSLLHADQYGTSYVGARPVQSAPKGPGTVYSGPTSSSQGSGVLGNLSATGGRLLTNNNTPGLASSQTLSTSLTQRVGSSVQRGAGLTCSSQTHVSELNTAPANVGLFTQILRNFLIKVYRRPVVAYFFCEQGEFVSRQLFADAQKYIYIVDGLSHILCASFVEDEYGVVQPSLSSVLSAFLDMLEAIDRHLKLCPIALRRPRGVLSLGPGATEQLDVVLRFALKASIKSAIYRIVTTFHRHLHAIELSTEHRRRLASFEEFRD